MKLGKIKLDWGWRYVDASIAVLGVTVAVLVWFIPSLDQNPDIQALYKRQREFKEYERQVAAEAARIKKEEDELGLIWIPPPPPKAAPAAAAPAKTPAAKPAAKPAQKPANKTQ